MAAKKPPKQKEIKIEVPEFESYEPESIEDYSSTYKQKPLGVVDFSADTRGGAIEELKAQQSGYLDKKSKLLDDYYGDQGTNWGDIIAEALLTVGPIFAGYALDKKQGGIYGSQIGMQVGNNYRQTREQDKQLERYRVGQQLENVDAQISAADKLRQEYLMQGFKQDDALELKREDVKNKQADREARLEDFGSQLQMRSQYGSGGAKKDAEPIPDFQRQALMEAWEGAGFKSDLAADVPITANQAKQMMELIEQQRLNKGETRRGTEYSGKTTSGILQPIPGTTPNQRNVKVAEETRNAVDALKLDMQDLSSLLENGVDITGPEAGRERQKIARLVDGVRRLYVQGANFTVMEKEMNIDQLLTMPSQSAIDTMADALRGIKQKGLLEGAMADFERYAQITETGNKLYSPKKQYLPGTLDRINPSLATGGADSQTGESPQSVNINGKTFSVGQTINGKTITGFKNVGGKWKAIGN